MDGCFGNTVHVDELGLHSAILLIPRFQCCNFESFSAEDHIPQTMGVGACALRCNQLPESAGCLVKHSNLFPAYQFVKVACRSGRILRNNNQTAAIKKGSPNLPYGEVERIRVEKRPDVAFVKVERSEEHTSELQSPM